MAINLPALPALHCLSVRLAVALLGWLDLFYLVESLNYYCMKVSISHIILQKQFIAMHILQQNKAVFRLLFMLL